MPQVVAAVLIGAGIAAGFKWIAREMARAVDDARGAHERPADAQRGGDAQGSRQRSSGTPRAASTGQPASAPQSEISLLDDQRLGACSLKSERSMPTTRDAGPLAFEQHWMLMRAPSNSRNTSSARSSGSA